MPQQGAAGSAASGPAPGLDPGATAVTTTGLAKRFRGGQLAVAGIDLLVPHGAVYGFLGPNGSGKTTTIRMLLGLVSPTAGSHTLLGRQMPAAAAQVLPRVGALVEGPAFHPYLSGRANLARLDAADRTADPSTAGRRIDAALDRVGLTAAAEEALPGLLAGHAAAARHRRRPAAAARAAHARRADERPRPAGHPRGPHAGPGARLRRRHRADLLPPAGRGRADLHARRRHARRQAGRPGHARRAAPQPAAPGRGRDRPPRPRPSGRSPSSA